MKKTCTQCSQFFPVTDDDLAFYAKVSPVIEGKTLRIPPPTLCPDCRMQRRLAFRNERNLYTRKCDLCQKEMISIYSPDKPYTVYCASCWWSDTWNPLDFGKDFDFSRPFFEQFEELWRKVPLIGLWNTKNENAEYNNNCFDLKDAYMNFNSDLGQNYYYCYITELCRDVMDCAFTYKSELCYELTDCFNCYSCTFSQKLENCSDCHFSSDLIGCKNCIGCHGLRHKEYYILNEKVSVEEFVKVRSQMYEPPARASLQKKSEELRLKTPHKHLTMTKCENSWGDYLYECKNVLNSYDVRDAENTQHVRYAPFGTRNTRDGYAVGGMEWAYEIMGGGLEVSTVAFMLYMSHGLRNSYYGVLCLNGSANVFGCVGLKKGQYCILNKQYSKEEYEELLPKIIEHMKKDASWGEFFPATMSPFGYNETLANESVPLNKEQAVAKGLRWADYQQPKPIVKMVKAAELPGIQASEEILKAAIECEASGKPFKVVPAELEFYKKLGLPLPTKHADQRYKERLALRNPRRMWERACAKCSTSIQTTYAPDRPEIVYCDKCYLEAVY